MARFIFYIVFILGMHSELGIQQYNRFFFNLSVLADVGHLIVIALSLIFTF